MSDTQRSDAIVVGAGISGLTTALLLQRAGKRVLLLEAATRVGEPFAANVATAG